MVGRRGLPCARMVAKGTVSFAQALTVLLALSAALTLGACGKSDGATHGGDETARAGGAGSSSAGAGMSQAGGVAGTSGAAPIAGAGGSSGQSPGGGVLGGGVPGGGAADRGGSAGSAGSTTAAGSAAFDAGVLPPGDDCDTVADCRLNDDCCTCSAYGKTSQPLDCSIKTCEETACQTLSKIPHELTCYHGHCEFAKLDCDPAHVTCSEEPPVCTDLFVPSVVDGCWGPCTLLVACKDVPYEGADCPDGYAKTYWWTCMSNPCSGGYQACVKIPPMCGETPRCDCGLAETCAARGFACEPGTTSIKQHFCCREGEGYCSLAP
jgi:hypothetical protein